MALLQIKALSALGMFKGTKLAYIEAMGIALRKMSSVTKSIRLLEVSRYVKELAK